MNAWLETRAVSTLAAVESQLINRQRERERGGGGGINQEESPALLLSPLHQVTAHPIRRV